MQTLNLNVDQEPSLHLWTREEYYCIAETGIFQGKRVELIEGQVIDMSPMKSSHATGVELVVSALRCGLGPEVFVREQKPLVLGPLSEPEPDVAVVSGTIRDYTQRHPQTALLVVEVSDSTLRFDQQNKGSLYAQTDLRDYWILNLVERCLEVYRSPIPDPEDLYGCRYGDQTIYWEGDQVTSLAFPELKIAVVDLLP